MANDTSDSAGGSPDLVTFMGQQLAGFGDAVVQEQDGGSTEDRAPDGTTGETPATPGASPDGEPQSASDEGAGAGTEGDGTDGGEASPDGETGTPDADALLEGYAPATYTADGQARTFDGVLIHPEHGAIVDPSAVPQLLDRLQKADHLEAANRQLYDQTQQLERLTAWTVKDANGQDRRLTGREAIEQQRLTTARLGAATGALNTLLQSPDAIARLLTVDTESGKVVFNPEAVQHFRTELKLAMRDAEDQTRAGMAALLSAPGTAPSIDFAAQGPGLVDQAIQFAGVNTPLSAETKADLVAALPQFVRAATPDDVARQPDLRLGQLLILPTFHALIKRMATVGSASPPSKTNQTNAARLAASRAGTPGKPGKPATTRTPVSSASTKKGSNAFDFMEAAASGHFLAPTDG